MSTKKDSIGVEKFLLYMLGNTNRTESFPELEKRFGITPYKQVGNRTKKIWSRFKRSNLSVPEFMTSRFGHYLGDGSDGYEAPDITHASTVEFITSRGGTEAYYSAPTDRLITTMEEAVQASGVDMSKWEVRDWRWKTWNTSAREKRQMGTAENGKPIFETYLVTKTNYGINIWFTAKSVEESEIIQRLTEQITSAIKTPKVKRTKTSRGTGVVNIADLHIGAEVRNLFKTPDFDMGKVVEYLSVVADEVNAMDFSEVYVNMLGDYFESISGHNHMSTFKSLTRDGWGSEIIIAACRILADFLCKIDNLRGVNMISGNHDRMSADNKEDNDGSAAHILFELLRKERSFEGVAFKYSPHVLVVDIDDVIYILTHGHQKLNSKAIEKIIWRYGKQGKYNVLLQGHVHTRLTTKSWMTKAAHFEDTVVVAADEADYRRITVPSIFTGNPYSLMLGYTTRGGFIVIHNNNRGSINTFDISL